MSVIEHSDVPDDDPFGCLCDRCNAESVDRAFAERETLREKNRALEAQLAGAVQERDEAVALLHKAAHRLVPVPPYQEIADWLTRYEGGQ